MEPYQGFRRASMIIPVIMLATLDYVLTRQWLAELEASGRDQLVLLYRRLKERIEYPTIWGHSAPNPYLNQPQLPFLPPDYDQNSQVESELSGRIKLDLLTGHAADLGPMAPSYPLLTPSQKHTTYPQLLSLYEKAKKETEELKERLEKVEGLHRELHHRTSNNLRQFKRFLRAALGKDCDGQAKVLNDILSRVDSMAALHGQMYGNEDVTSLNFKSYLVQMHRRLEELFDMDIDLTIDCTYHPDPNSALQLGLVVNEMMTNSFKYAFPKTDDPICRIQCHENAGQVVFTFSDNGGKMEGTGKIGFGSRLISQIVDQLGGVHHMTNDRIGTSHHILLKPAA